MARQPETLLHRPACRCGFLPCRAFVQRPLAV